MCADCGVRVEMLPWTDGKQRKTRAMMVFLATWARRLSCKEVVMRSRLEPMKKVARGIRKHRELILNWFVANKVFSAGIVEGFNNKVKLTSRKAYGFRTPETAKMALYHILADLPEPKLHHRFC